MGWNQGLFEEMLKKKYDLKQQEVDIAKSEQLAKAPYYASAAVENTAKAGVYPSYTEENLAKAKLYGAQAVGQQTETGILNKVAPYAVYNKYLESLRGERDFNAKYAPGSGAPGSLATPKFNAFDSAEFNAQTSPEAFEAQGPYQRTYPNHRMFSNDAEMEPDAAKYFSPSFWGSLFSRSIKGTAFPK